MTTWSLDGAAGGGAGSKGSLSAAVQEPELDEMKSLGARWNQMAWKSYETDARTVTIMLTNTNKTLLNDDYEIGNALQGAQNSAMVYVPCVAPASGYALLFVNPDKYDHQHKVLYTSAQFVVRPKGSAPDPASGQQSIPSHIQPYLETPGIVLPANKAGEVTNTTSTGNSAESELPKLGGESSAFKSFLPEAHDNAAAPREAQEGLAWALGAITVALILAVV
ncbi:hypothetical protein PaG_06139 [Moesziomyces aphidis]|uniref:Uncharacterized protein n=1 Tax=Moesziomyces aphidis TaxID=84754 RepID=W3VGI3_MOEAP|nr:hypothetical protein PaG_06139 [Moesziomyces aphidis]